jgi:hypothetical protein
MPVAPGTIEIGKSRIAYEETRGSDGTQAYFLRQRALIRLNNDLVKVERSQDTTVLCDEEKSRKATGNRPSPLQYFIASIAFCMFSQLARFAARLDVQLDDAVMDLSISYDLSAMLRLPIKSNSPSNESYNICRTRKIGVGRCIRTSRTAGLSQRPCGFAEPIYTSQHKPVWGKK